MKLNGRQTLSIIVQPATIADLERIYQIERECFTTEAFGKQYLACLLESPDAVSLIAKMENSIVGFIIGLVNRHAEETTGRVYTLDVVAEYRRRGVGLKLLEEIEQIFEEKGVEICYLEVREGNVGARKFYRKHGYVKAKKLRGYYKGAHGVQLKKRLKV
jgi:ribosomal-protein-alanine N-acetyltransferase